MKLEEMKAVVAECKFWGYTLLVRETHGGIVLQAGYDDLDVNTSKPCWQVTRKWLLSPFATKSEIVQTAFKCVLTSMEHRTREGFLYRGKRIYGPHFDVDALHAICDKLDARE
jgi:hypothetical protein